MTPLMKTPTTLPERLRAARKTFTNKPVMSLFEQIDLVQVLSDAEAFVAYATRENRRLVRERDRALEQLRTRSRLTK